MSIELNPAWDCGQWRNCFHMNPAGCPDPNTNKKMCDLAIKERRYSIMWGVVNPGNALCHSVHRRKIDAERARKEHAWAYVVVKVVVTPLYEQNPEARIDFLQGIRKANQT